MTYLNRLTLAKVGVGRVVLSKSAHEKGQNSEELDEHLHLGG